MKLFILGGKQHMGKTTTLGIFVNKFSNAEIYLLDGQGNIIGNMLTKLNASQLGKDFVAKVYYKDRIIGIVSKGDRYDMVTNAFSSLFSLLKKKEKFDCIVCASRNNEKNSINIIGTIMSILQQNINKLKYLSNYVDIIHKTVGNPNAGSNDPVNQRANKKNANGIYKKL